MNILPQFSVDICIILCYNVKKGGIIIFFQLHIKKYRLFSGLTQEQLAEKAGLTQMYISYLERDNRKKSPTLNTIAKLAQALEVCPYVLMDFECGEYERYCGKFSKECPKK